MDKGSEFHSALGKYIKQMRLKSGLTQADVAKVLGYKAQFVANWERGASSPPSHILRKLVTVLRIPEDEILELLNDISIRYWRSIVKADRGKKKHA